MKTACSLSEHVRVSLAKPRKPFFSTMAAASANVSGLKHLLVFLMTQPRGRLGEIVLHLSSEKGPWPLGKGKPVL